jgi:hypothetical protein
MIYLQIKNSAYSFPLIFKRETREEINDLLKSFEVEKYHKEYKIIE